jgi:hypothetical protein
MKQCEKRHDEARGAEPALGSMMLDKRTLDRMEFAVIGKILNRDDLAAVRLTGKHDAGVDRLIHPFLVYNAAQYHGTGSAIALRAAFLGARRTFHQTQIVKQRQRRSVVLEANGPPATQKLYGTTHLRVPKP